MGRDCLFLYTKAPQNCYPALLCPSFKSWSAHPSQCCLASPFLQSSEKSKCLLSGRTLSSKYILVIAVKCWCQLYLKIKLHSTGLPTPTTKLLLFQSHPIRRLLHSCSLPSHRAPLPKPNCFSLPETDVCRCCRTQTRVFGKLPKAELSVFFRALPAFQAILQVLSFARCPHPPSDRSYLLLCCSTALQLQMSSEIPLPPGNHPSSHRVRSSPSFVGLIFICDFKCVQMFNSCLRRITYKKFHLISLLIPSPLSGAHWYLLREYNRTSEESRASCDSVCILPWIIAVLLSAVCRQSLKLCDFKVKYCCQVSFA